MMLRKAKKIIGTLLIAIFITSSIASPVSAACPDDKNDFIQYFCSGVLQHMELDTCPWAGGSGGGYYHPSNCQIIRYYNYTGEICTKCGYYNNRINSHLCHAEHPQAGIYINNCQY